MKLKDQFRKSIQHPIQRKHQSGVTLVVALIILLVLSIVVATSNQTVVLQERMAGAVRDSHLALQVAEAGLIEGERYIAGITGTTIFTSTGANGLYATNFGPSDVFASSNWSNSTNIRSINVAYDVDGDGTNSNFEAQFFIEHLGVLEEPVFGSTDINIMNYGQTTGGGDVEGFRIVSRAVGMSGGAERIVVGYFGKRI